MPPGMKHAQVFSERSFSEAVLRFTEQVGGKPRDISRNVQFSYLCRFLNNRNCLSFVVEEPYIDRDYMDDFSAFYSRCHRYYPNYCQRFHFFRKEANRLGLRQILAEISTTPESTDQPRHRALNDTYLGFMVLRPNPQAFVGRTVITPWLDSPPAERGKPDGDGRYYDCVRGYKVDLAGVELSLDGLGFQQQDQAVSACATTAIWVALQKTAHDVNFRIPTPSEITAGATRFSVEFGRPIPNAGLNIGQMSEAIRACNLEPELIPVPAAQTDPSFFRRACHAYLRSGFPIAAGIHRYDRDQYERALNAHGKLPEVRARESLAALSSNAHAVTFAGFRYGSEPASPVRFPDAKSGSKSTFIAGNWLEELYCHDDRLGPYARVECLKPPWGRFDIAIRRDDKPDWAEYWLVTHLLVPLYPKIRLPYFRVEVTAMEFLDVFTDLVPEVPPEAYELDFRIIEGTKYRRELLRTLYRDRPYDRLSSRDLERLAVILNDGSIPRYVAVCQVSLKKARVLDLLIDTTESPVGDSLFAVVCRDSNLAERAGTFSVQTGYRFLP
jgi:hypothetical protein